MSFSIRCAGTKDEVKAMVMATPHCPSKVKELVVELIDGIDLEARAKWSPEFKWGVAVGCYGHFDTNCSTMGDLKVEAIQLGLSAPGSVSSG